MASEAKVKKPIAAIFQRAKLAKPKQTACPMCGKVVLVKCINRHLDSNCRLEIVEIDLVGDDDGSEVKSGAKGHQAISRDRQNHSDRERKREEEEKNYDDLFPDSDTEYDLVSSQESVNEHTTPKKVKKASPSTPTNGLERSYSFEAHVPRHFSQSPGQSPRVESFSQPTTPTSEKKVKLRASRFVSNNVNRFGGLSQISSQGEVELSPSPKRRRGGSRFSPFSQLPSPSPKKKRADSPGTSPKAKKNLFQDEKDADEVAETKHIPYTQSRKSDPTFVPYYVVNFEHILRGVIDETDDKELFNEEELEFVAKFREGLSLDGKKMFVRLFGRKFSWITVENIKYEEIADKEKALLELEALGFVQNGNESIIV